MDKIQALVMVAGFLSGIIFFTGLFHLSVPMILLGLLMFLAIRLALYVTYHDLL